MTFRVARFLRYTAPHRGRYGLLRGVRLALYLRRRFTLPAGTPFPVRLPGSQHPIHLRAGTSDYTSLWQIFLNDELGFDLPDSPRFIIDAGANIGCASVYLAHRFPEARIVALEVDRSNFELLKLNTAPYPNVVPLLAGLWNGRTRLLIDDRSVEHNCFTVSESGESTGGIEGFSVGDILDEQGEERVDLLKIDIEGAEVEVFRWGTESWLPRVGTIAVELHDRVRPGCSETVLGAVAGTGLHAEQHGEYTLLRRFATGS